MTARDGRRSRRSRTTSCAPASRAAALELLAEADAFRSLGLDRREALWAVKGLAARWAPSARRRCWPRQSAEGGPGRSCRS